PSSDIYTLSLHDALPIFAANFAALHLGNFDDAHPAHSHRLHVLLMAQDRNRILVARLLYIQLLGGVVDRRGARNRQAILVAQDRSEEHTSELQSRENLVC